MSIYQFLLNRGAFGLVAFLVLCPTGGSAKTLAAQTVTVATGAVNDDITGGDHRTARFSDRRALIS